MKKLKINSLLLIFFPLICWGQNFGFVNSVTGKAFLIDEYENTKILKRGDALEFNSQVLVEEQGQLTFSDYNDRQYNLASEGHITFSNGLIEVKKGFLRIKSRFTTNKAMNIKTANSQTSFTTGEAILSYDLSNGSTQLLSIDGKFKFKNPFLAGSNIEVYGGQFSTVQTDLSGGQPQAAAKIGENSLSLATAKFYSMKAPARSISSVRRPSSARGKIIFIPLDRAKKVVKSPESEGKVRELSKKTEVKVQIFGQKEKTRKMASEENELDSLIKALKAVK